MTPDQIDKASAANATGPRVTLKDIEDNIAAEYFVTGAQAVGDKVPVKSGSALNVLTVCFFELKNGFIVVGKAAPAAPENFNVELGRKFAREDAIKQCWPIMGYALRERLSKV